MHVFLKVLIIALSLRYGEQEILQPRKPLSICNILRKEIKLHQRVSPSDMLFIYRETSKNVSYVFSCILGKRLFALLQFMCCLILILNLKVNLKVMIFPQVYESCFSIYNADKFLKITLKAFQLTFGPI